MPESEIPMLQDNEARMLKLRKKLERIFSELELIRDVIIVAYTACKGQNADADPEIERVLRDCASNPLHSQMAHLTDVIEKLGGRTQFTEDREDEIRMHGSAVPIV
ncbi:MAG: hypothetical protein ACJ8R9_10810 [Steroidobacteraceae bacterium]